jgi:hypothetical protein
MSIPDETSHLISQCVEGFQKFRDQKLQFLKESLLNENFIIHPKIIANNWLNQDDRGLTTSQHHS